MSNVISLENHRRELQLLAEWDELLLSPMLPGDAEDPVEALCGYAGIQLDGTARQVRFEGDSAVRAKVAAQVLGMPWDAQDYDVVTAVHAVLRGWLIARVLYDIEASAQVSDSFNSKRQLQLIKERWGLKGDITRELPGRAP